MHTSYFHCHLLQISASNYHLHNVESWYMIRFLTEAGAHPCWHEVTSPIPRWGMRARRERGGREERFESRGRAEWITSGHSCLDRLWKSSSLSHERKDIPPESWHTLPHTSKVKGRNCRFTFFRRHYFSCQDYMLGKSFRSIQSLSRHSGSHLLWFISSSGVSWCHPFWSEI